MDLHTLKLTVEYVPAIWFFAAMGSFYGVALCRLPQGKSLAGRSHCDKCGATIPWYHNIPIVSYIALGGRSHCCQERINSDFLSIELLNIVVGIICLALAPTTLIACAAYLIISAAITGVLVFFAKKLA